MTIATALFTTYTKLIDHPLGSPFFLSPSCPSMSNSLNQSRHGSPATQAPVVTKGIGMVMARQQMFLTLLMRE